MIRAEKRRTGSFYTPVALADEVVRRALAPLTARSSRPALRICDPACGDGAFLAAARRVLADAELVGVDTDAEALGRASRRVPGATLHRADALAMDWGEERFDAVIGNPPWISYSGRHAQPLPAARRRFLADRYETFSGWPSLHGPFLELSVRLARHRVGLLLPAQVCDLDGYRAVRAFVRSRCSVEPPLDCGEQSFSGVTQPACAVFLEVDGGSTRGDAPFLLLGPDRFANFARPPASAFGDIGVHTGNCARKVLRAGGVPIREGRDVTPFELRAPRLSCHPDTPKEPGDYFRAGPLERYRAVPIVLRQTADRPIAALHTEPTYFRNSVLACFGIEGWPHEVTVSWLNSSVIADYHRTRVREAGQAAFPQLKLKHLRDLPMPHPETAPRGLAALVVARDAALDQVVADWFGRGS